MGGGGGESSVLVNSTVGSTRVDTGSDGKVIDGVWVGCTVGCAMSVPETWFFCNAGVQPITDSAIKSIQIQVGFFLISPPVLASI
jgi:hypothetical protein